MFPISKRALASIVAVCLLSITLFAAPAHAAGARGVQAQDTGIVSIFSLSFWQSALSPILSWTWSHDHETTAAQTDTPQSIFSNVRGFLDPDGVAATGTSSDPTFSPGLQGGN